MQSCSLLSCVYGMPSPRLPTKPIPHCHSYQAVKSHSEFCNLVVRNRAGQLQLPDQNSLWPTHPLMLSTGSDGAYGVKHSRRSCFGNHALAANSRHFPLDNLNALILVFRHTLSNFEFSAYTGYPSCFLNIFLVVY